MESEILELININSKNFDKFKDDFIKVLVENNMTYELPINWDKYILDCFHLKYKDETIAFILVEKRFPVNISKFAIANEWQQKGIGTIALKLWEEHYNMLFLKLNVFNYMIHLECDEKTYGFYEKQGYKKYGGYKKEKDGKILDRIFMNKQIFLKD